MPAFPPEIPDKATFDMKVSRGWWLRTRLLTPVEAAEAGELLALALALCAPGDGEAANAKRITRRRAIETEAKADNLLCTCCVAGSTDKETFEALKLVPKFEQQDPDHNILWVGVINPEQRGALITRMFAKYCKAREVLRPFRDQPKAARAARRIRKTLRKEPV